MCLFVVQFVMMWVGWVLALLVLKFFSDLLLNVSHISHMGEGGHMLCTFG